MIEAGTVVRVGGLRSATGKKLNGNRAVVIRYVAEEGRWQVRIEGESQLGRNATKSIKEVNLSPVRRLPLPTAMDRGNATDLDNVVPKCCELLLYYKDNFRPSEIMFVGYAAMAFMRLGEENFGHFVATQIEQMGGVLALASICREGGEPGTESVLFGLLEGDEMYVDVLIQTLHWTGLIAGDCESESSGKRFREAFSNIPPWNLTGDQDSAPYVRAMKEGPLSLLEEMSRYGFGNALWAAAKRSEFYHLLVQRLLRLVARESTKTRDGAALGPTARTVLTRMVPVTGLERPVSPDVARNILQLTRPCRETRVLDTTTERVQNIIDGVATESTED